LSLNLKKQPTYNLAAITTCTFCRESHFFATSEVFIMQIEVLKSKIHRAVLTDANLHYVGSCTIDEDLLVAAGMIANEKIHIVNVNNGARLETYIIKGERGSGIVALNGPSARLAQPGDIIIIMSYAIMDFESAKTYEPKVVFPKEGNKL
jgi:aspartate 1-decarboxylase